MDITGARFGPYELVGLLGAGGMGEVYRAKDPRLQREVALKILSASAAGDVVRQQRLLGEARAAGALNHPNILAVYDVGTEQGVTFIVSELVDGTSLREQMERGPVPIRELLDLAVQIADGLAAAHEAGIVHRDLKPENVMVTRDGRVKLVDFGLAQMHDTVWGGQPGRDVDEPASVRSTRTDAALIVGTVPYMSPEQARGVAADFRSDQFSFGLMLYELATGQAAFKRETPVETLAAIINEEPRPISELNARVPVALRWVIERCLAKEPRRRYAATADLARDLHTLRERLSEVTTAQAMVAIPERKRWKVAMVGGALVLGLAAIVVGFGALAPPGTDFTAYRLTPFATDPGYQGTPAWSPDGKTIAYAAEVDDVTQIFTRSVGSPMRAKITSARFHCRDPFWSPDGTRIFYISLARDKEGLWSVSAAGGTPELVMENATAAALSPDGKTLAFAREELYQGSASEMIWLSSPPGAEPRSYPQPPFSASSSTSSSDITLHFSPDGTTIGVWATTIPFRPSSAPVPVLESESPPTAGRQRFWIVPLRGAAPHPVPDFFSQLPSNPVPFAWMPDNRHIVASIWEGATSDTTRNHLWLLDTGGSAPRRMTITGMNETSPAVSADGKTIAYASEAIDFDIIELPLDGSPPRTILATSRNEMDPVWSPTNAEFVFVTDRMGHVQIWLRSQNGQWERSVVTEHDFPDSTFYLSAPTFSPDGQRIAYTRQSPSGYRVWTSMLAGGPPVRLDPTAFFQDAPSWSPDGNWIAYVRAAYGHWNLVKKPAGGGQVSQIMKEDVVPRSSVHWSPSGEWIACMTAQGLTLASSDGAKSRTISSGDWLAFDWAGDGTRLYGIRPSDDLRHLVLASVDVATGKEQILTPNLGTIPLMPGPIRGFTRMPNKSFATSIVHVRSEVWLLEGFSNPGTRLFERLWPTRRVEQH